MKIAVLCATNRGLRFLERLFALCSSDKFYVFSFPEEPWEPRYLDDIHSLAASQNATFFETRRVGNAEFAELWGSMDLMFVVSWRYLIPMKVADRIRLGCVVFHDSLLPQYRGFSPTVWAMINGERCTGVTMFHLAEQVDAGDIIDQEMVSIGPHSDIQQVMNNVTNTYLGLLERNLAVIKEGQASRRPQDHSLATYTCKRMPEDAEIDWTASTNSIYNLIRAVTWPYTGAFTWYRQSKLTIWSALPVEAKNYAGRIPGRVVEIRPSEGIVVLTGDGCLLVKQVQIDSGPVEFADALITSITCRFGAKRSA